MPDYTAANTICLLDDEQVVLRGMGRLLSSVGCNVRPFSNPQELLAYARTHRPPVAVVDIWMPIMNGLEVLSRLREISPSTRVIMFSGKDDPLVRTTAMEGGAMAFFLKPMPNEDFITAVRLALAAVD